MSDIEAFCHRLALQLGIADVDQMLNQMSAEQLIKWVEFYKREPWGRLASDQLTATLCSMYQNRYRGKSQAMTPTDFLPYYDDGLDPLTRSLVRARNG